MVATVHSRPSWHDIEKGVAYLALNIMKDGKPDLIIGLSRGGLIPAVTLSHMLDDTPVLPLQYSSQRGRGDDKNQNQALPELDKDMRILIVDDIADSGNTLDELCLFYGTHNISTAVLYYKQFSVHTPRYLWQHIPPDAPWIIFPWETH